MVIAERMMNGYGVLCSGVVVQCVVCVKWRWLRWAVGGGRKVDDKSRNY